MAWMAPLDYLTRPVTILGGGVLGRRIAACWVSAGYNVHVRDPDGTTLSACVSYVNDQAASYPASVTRKRPIGKISTFTDLASAVAPAWLVIEAIPEKLPLKIATFAELEGLAPRDAILATNSSSYKSSEMLAGLQREETKTRILNTHYYMPPRVMIVELMTDGATDEAIFSFLAERQREAGTLPYRARRESTGLIFNRLWAAVKREVLTILAEGVSVPKEVDELWNVMFVKGGQSPCRMMDDVGLDTVAFIEEHYIAERGLSPAKTVDFLQTNYISAGKLGSKSRNGGLYPHLPRLLVLDVGLAASTLSLSGGCILSVSADGSSQSVLVANQALPDGIDVDITVGRIFWTCMGWPGQDSGEVFSAALDGSDVKCIVPQGRVNTPKQLVVERTSKKLYFTDREGLRVLRCNYDGTVFEALVQRGDWKTEGFDDQTKWCVGIAVSPKIGKFYWTQKGYSKAGKGRIFCANIQTPAGQDASSRTDVQLLQDHLPEPIDLEIDEGTNNLYWTDRGELPFGNSVNRGTLDPVTGLFARAAEGTVMPYEVITRHLNEAIGLKLDTQNGHMYLTDLGGSLYRCNLDGTDKMRIFSSDERALTGIALV